MWEWTAPTSLSLLQALLIHRHLNEPCDAPPLTGQSAVSGGGAPSPSVSTTLDHTETGNTDITSGTFISKPLSGKSETFEQPVT